MNEQGIALGSGVIRQNYSDFQVDEILPFEPDGDGQHVLLHVRKTNLNTTEVANKLAKLAGVPVSAVGYAGLKDRRAITTQWFSVDLSGKSEQDWADGITADIEIMSVHRHGKKLRRGSHTANRFQIVIRELQLGDEAELQARLAVIAKQGVPNYFGPQRFGFYQGQHGSNLFTAWKAAQSNKANKAFQRFSRQRKSLAISAARSWVFNQQLTQCVESDDWQTCNDESWPTLELFTNQASVAGVAAEMQPLLTWLAKQRLSPQRRSMVLMPEALAWELSEELADATLTLRFELRRGGFATAVLRELLDINSANH